MNSRFPNRNRTGGSSPILPFGEPKPEPGRNRNLPWFRFTVRFRFLALQFRFGSNRGTKPELECFDIGMIETVGYFVRKGVLKTPVYLQFIMGAMGGVGASPEKLYFMYRSACDILGEGNFVWSTGGAGKEQFNMCTAAMLLGGTVRVGIEDNVYLRKGVLAKTNAEQVTKMRGIIETLEREVATPDEAREILGLSPLKK